MQNKEKYSDRRRNIRRHDRSSDPAFEISLPDQDKRHGDRRCNNSRRGNERLNVSFEVLLPDQDGMTTNVSASGVCFEVAKRDMKAFTPGKIISLQMIDSVTNTPRYQERKLKLSRRGTVVRNCLIEDSNHDNILGVALKFTKKIKIKVLDSD